MERRPFISGIAKISPLCIGLFILLFIPPTGAHAATKTWDGGGSGNLCSTDANWSDDTKPVTGDDIVLDGTSTKNMSWDSSCPSSVTSFSMNSGYTGTVTINTTYSGGFQTLTITGDLTINAGTMTHQDNSTAETNRLNLSVGGDFTLGASGTISANALGYDEKNGTGVGPPGFAGGSYGGTGGYLVGNGTFGVTYGSFTAPTNIGSGGVNASGGGAIQLTVTGASSIEGTISANGAASTTGGSGGSIYLTTGTISGSGTVRANGGGQSTYGAGGGGRIALILTGSSADFSSYTATTTTYGGTSATNNNGAAGTVYKQTTAQGSNGGVLTIDNNNLTTDSTVLTYLDATTSRSVTVGSINLSNKGLFAIGSDDTLTTSSTGTTVTIASGTAITNSGTISIGGTGVSNSGTFTNSSGSTTAFTGQTDDSAVTIPSSTYYTLTVNNAGTLFSQGGSTTVNTALNVTAGTYYLNGNSLTATGATINNDDYIRLNGSETVTGFTNDTDSGTVIYTGTSNQTGLKTGNSYYNLTINDGLIGYWKLDEGSGTTTADSSGYGNVGTLTNGPTWSSSISSAITFTDPSAVVLDGTNDYVDIDTLLDTVPSNGTISLWFNRTSGTDRRLFTKVNDETGGSLDMIDIYTDTSNHLVVRKFNNSGSAISLAGTTTLSAGTWYNLVLVWGSGGFKAYINGIQEASNADTNAWSSGTTRNVIVGGYNFGGTPSNFFTGSIDDLRVYSRALTTTEVSSLAAGTQPASATATYTLNAALDVNGDFTLASGGLDVSSSNYAITTAGSWNNYGGVFTKRSGTVTFDGTSTGKTLRSGGQDFNNLTVSGSGGGWTLTQDLYVTNSLTQSNGTLNTSTSNYNIYAGNLSQTAGTLTTNASRITVDSSSAQTLTAASTLYDLTIGDNLKRGLVGYWKFDEGTGTTTADSSSTGNTGTLTNGPVWVAGAPKLDYTNPYALNFDGIDDYVHIPTNSAFTLGNTATISLWVKFDTLPSGTHEIIGNQTATSTYSNGFLLSQFGSDFLVYWKSGGPVKTHTNALSAGVWTHLVVVNNNGTMTTYKDGSQLSTTYTSGGPITASLDARIGGSTTWVTDSSIDDVRMYNRALSTTEITELTNGAHNIINTSSTGTYTLGAALTVSNVLTIQTGTLDVSASNYGITAGTWTDNGTFVPRSGTLTLTNTGTLTESGSLYNLTVNGSGKTVTLGQNTTVGNNLTITTGTLDVSSGNNYSLSVGGNFSNAGTFTARNGTVTLTSTSGSATLTSGGTSFYNLTQNGVGGTYTAQDALIATHALTITNGTLDIGSQNLTTTGATFSNDGTLRLVGTQTVTGFTNDTDSGTVIYSGTSNQTGLKLGNTYYNLTINDGLVGYWRFDEGSGTVATDSSGYGNTGTLTNGPTWSTTVPTTAFTNPYSLSFDGTNDYARVSNVTSGLNEVANFTLSAWVNPDNLTGFQRVISSGITGDSSPPGANEYSMLFSENKLTYQVRNVGHTTVSSTAVANSAWSHVAVTFVDSTNTVKFFINGIQDGATATNTNSVDNNSITDLYIGSSNGPGQFFNGKIDDVRIYNRALSATEVSSLAAGTQPASATATYTLNAALDVNGDFTLASGGLDVSSSNYAITTAGSWNNYGGVFTKRSGTVTFDGTSTGKTLQSGNQHFNNLTVSGSGGGWTLASRLFVDGTLSQTAGTLDVSSSNYNVTTKTFSQTAGTFTAQSGTVTTKATSATTLSASNSLYNLQVENPNETNLVGYWKFDEGVGTSAVDSSGNGNTGTLTNNPSWSTTTAGLSTFDNPYSLSFDGTDDYVTATGAMNVQNFTLAAWVYNKSLSSFDRVLDARPNHYYSMLTSGNKLTFQINNAGHTNTSTTSLSTNTWYHVAVRYSSGTLNMYINGVQDATVVTGLSDPTQSTTSVELGGINGFSQSWDGFLDDIRIYNTALTPTQIASLAAGKYAGAGSGATTTLGAALTTSNNLTIQAGTLDVSASNYALAVGGNYANYGTFTARSGTATFNKSSSTQTLNSGGSSFYNLTHSGAGILQLVTNALTVSNNLTNSAGTLDANGLAINVAGNWDNNGGTYTANGNTVTLNGTNQSVLGATTFYNLTKTVSSAATLTFEAAKSFVVSAALTLQGAANNLLSIVSSVLNTQFNINIPSSFTLNFLNIRDLNNSNATSRAVTNSQNSGNNTNITFTATTVTWTGTTNTDWGTATNWDVGYVPNATDNIVIPNTSNKPLLDTNRTVNNLSITHASAILDLNGKNLTMTGTFSNIGTLKLQGGETLTGFTNDTDSGTTLYYGTSTYTTLHAGDSYYNLTFNGSGGNWTAATTATVNGTLTVTAGTLVTGSSGGITTTGTGTTISIGASGTLTNNGSLTIGGAATPISNSGTWTNASTSTVTYTGQSDNTGVTVPNASYGNIAFNKSGTTFTLGAALAPAGNLTITAGTLDVSGSNYGITLAGNFSNSGTFTKRNGMVTFNKSSGTQTVTSGGTSFYNVTHSGAGTLQMSDTFIVSNTLTNSAGIFDLNGNAFTATGATIDNTATMQAQGGETVTGFTNDSNSGTIQYSGSGSYTGLSLGNTYYDLSFTGSGTWTLATSPTINNNLMISSGTLALAGNDLSVPGTFTTGGTLMLNGAETSVTSPSNLTTAGTVAYNNSAAVTSFLLGNTYYNLTVQGTGTVTLNADLTTNGNLTIASGATLDFNGYDPSIAGNFTNSGTVLGTSTRTFTLNGIAQTFNPASAIIKNLILLGSSGTVSLGSDTTITDLISIAAGRVLSLISYVFTGQGTISNSGTINNGTGRFVHSSSGFYFANADYDEAPTYSVPAEKIYLTVTDSNRNLNGGSPDTLSVTVTAPHDSESVTLTETGNATGIFRSGGLTTALYTGSASTNDGTLHVSDDDTISATYTDAYDNADTIMKTATVSSTARATAPSGFEGVALSSTSIQWTWTDTSTNEQGFKLYDSSNNLIATIATPNTTSYTETGLTKGTTYTRKVVAYNEAGNSSYSNSASATTPAEPNAPSSFNGTSASNTSITWTWTDNSSDEVGFKLLDGNGTLIATIATPNTTSYTETGLTKGVSYTRKLVAYNDDGTSSASNTATVQTGTENPGSFTLLSPSDNALLTTGLPTFSFKKSIESGGSIASYTLYVGSLSFTGIPAQGNEASSPASHTHSANTYTAQYFNEGDDDATNDYITVTLKDGSGDLPLGDGKYVWYVRATDDGGSSTVSEDRTIHIDTTAPTLSSFDIPSATKKSATSFTTASTNGRLTFTVSDTRALAQATVTFQRARTVLGVVSSYTASETQTYVVTGRTQRITFTPKQSLSLGESYRYVISVTDSAGNTTQATVLLSVLSEKEAAEEEISKLDPETTPTETIVEKLREVLPESPLNLVQLQEKAVVRRQLQAEEFKKFLNPLLATFFNGRGRIEQAFVFAIEQIGRGINTVATRVASLLERSVEFASTVSKSLIASVQATGDSLRQVLARIDITTPLTKLSDALTVQRQTSIAAVNYGIEGYNSTVNTLVKGTGIIVDGTFQAMSTIHPLQDARTAGSRLATVFENGRDIRVRQGLANRQKIDRTLQALLNPVQRHGSQIALKIRATYEVWGDKTPTKIMNIAMKNISPTSLVVTWDTNHVTHLGKVNYGTTTSYGQEVFEEEGLRDHHEVTLNNLTPGTTYYFEVMNQNGGYVYDAYYAVTTPKEGEDIESVIPQDAILEGTSPLPVYAEPQPSATIVQTIQPGTILRTLTERDGWISLLLPSGRGVWIEKEHIRLVPHEGISASAQH